MTSTEISPPIRLTEEQLAHYYREGYLLVPGLVPVSSIQAVLSAAPPIPHDGRWQAVIFDHKNPGKDTAIHRLLVEPAIVEAVGDIFAMPVRIYYGMLAVVTAHGGSGLPWHQDNQYNHVVGGGALNVFVALTGITQKKAGLWVAPQSHRRGVQPSKRNETTAPGHREAVVEPENGIPLPPMAPGDVCIFDRSTYHRSLKNETDEDRYAYASQYVAANSRYAETGAASALWILASELQKVVAEA